MTLGASASLGSPFPSSPTRDQIAALQKATKMPQTHIAVVGNTGAGKSCLLNALLDEEAMLPTSAMRACTAVVVEISRAAEGSPYEADVEFLSREVGVGCLGQCLPAQDQSWGDPAWPWPSSLEDGEEASGLGSGLAIVSPAAERPSGTPFPLFFCTPGVEQGAGSPPGGHEGQGRRSEEALPGSQDGSRGGLQPGEGRLRKSGRAGEAGRQAGSDPTPGDGQAHLCRDGKRSCSPGGPARKVGFVGEGEVRVELLTFSFLHTCFCGFDVPSIQPILSHFEFGKKFKT